MSDAVKTAIDVGYRLIDCAYIYRSEGAVGKAIADKVKEGVVTRKDLFVTTKVCVLRVLRVGCLSELKLTKKITKRTSLSPPRYVC